MAFSVTPNSGAARVLSRTFVVIVAERSVPAVSICGWKINLTQNPLELDHPSLRPSGFHPPAST